MNNVLLKLQFAAPFVPLTFSGQRLPNKTHLSLALVIRPFCFGRAAIGVVVPATDKHLLNRKTLFRLFPSEVETRELCKNIAAKFRESRVMLPTLKFHFYGTMASHSRNQAGMFLHYSVEREERESDRERQRKTDRQT